MDDLTKSSSLPHQVWTVCVCVGEQLVRCRIDLLLAGLSSAKSPNPLIQELLHINSLSVPPVLVIYIFFNNSSSSFHAVWAVLYMFLYMCFYLFCGHLSKIQNPKISLRRPGSVG